jgi:carboxyl-terminal processing protease
MFTNRHTTLLAIVPVLALLFSVQWASGESAVKAPDYKELRLFRNVMNLVQKNYVKDVPDKELIEGAINGMLQSLDPHSAFLTEDMFKELQEETRSEFHGLGVEITLENGILTVVSPIEDTPAFKAGVKPGDKIVKIDDESTKNMNLVKAVKMMRGPRGTKVKLTIMRDGFKRFKDFTITRDVIHVKSVKKQEIEPGYPYIKLVSFSESADANLAKAIKELGDEQKIKGLILDLRSNPGGLLDQAVKVSEMFVDKGLIVYTDGKAKDQRMEFRSRTGGKHYNFKMAVLINQGSASASEILAGALQDYDRALIVGEKSFGKASVQTIIPFENGTGLRLTTAYYYTPKGRNIQKTGIVPDVDMKKEIQKQQDAEQQEEANNKQKKAIFPRPIVDLEHDRVVKKALEWLKSETTVRQFKDDLQNQKKAAVPDTALFQDD